MTWRVIRLCRKTWLDPAGFAQRFPLNYRPDSAFGFRILILASTVLIWFVAAFCVVAVLSGGNLHGAEFVLLVPFIATPVGVCFCEWVLSLFLDRAVRRVGVPVIYHTSASSTSWRGLVGFFRSFLILDSVLIGGVWITSACYEPLAIPKLGWTAIAGCFVWWWICLGLAVWTCSESGTGRAIFILVIPLVGVLSILLAAFATTLCLFGLAR